jgi:TPR repeat protein
MQVKDIKERVGFQQEHMTLTLTITAQVDLAEVRKQLARYPTASANGEKRNNDAERLKQLQAQIEEIQKQEHLAWLDFPVRNETHEKPSMPIVDTDIKEMIFQAEQGDARAQNSLGWLYDAGIGVESDRAKAKKWFEKSALAGNGMARLELLVNGSRVVRDSPSLELEWLLQAGEQGNVAAQYWLGMNYAVGSDVLKDMGKARHWFQKSATQGNWVAQARLGAMYSSGMGVPLDYVRAYMWYSLVITNSNSSKSALTHAEEGRTFVAQFMTPAQVTEAQRMECEVQELKGC